MPPALALLPALAAFGGSELLPALLGPELLGIGTETLGGLAGGALAGGLTDKKDPLKGALLGGVTGAVGGPGLAEGANGLLGIGEGLGQAAGGGVLGTGTTLGSGAGAGLGDAAGGLSSSVGKLGSGLAAATSGLGATPGGAAATAAPASVAGAPGSVPGVSDAFTGSGVGGSGVSPNDPAASLFNSTPGTSLTGGIPPSSSSSLGSGAGSSFGGGGGAAAAAPAADAAAGSTPSAFGTAIEDPTLANILSAGKANSNLILPTVGLGLSALNANRPLPGEAALSKEASTLGKQGTQLQSYLTSGQLPPGVQTGLHAATEAAKATLRTQFARMNMGGSSSEAEALASIDMTAQAQGAQIAMNLLDRGVQESGLSAQLYQVILQNALQQDQQLGSAVGNFASALAGGTGQPRQALAA